MASLQAVAPGGILVIKSKVIPAGGHLRPEVMVDTSSVHVGEVGRSGFDLSESGRPRGLNPAGGRGKTKTKTGARGRGGAAWGSRGWLHPLNTAAAARVRCAP